MACGDQVELTYAESSKSDSILKAKTSGMLSRIYSMTLYELGFPKLGWIKFQSLSDNQDGKIIELAGNSNDVMGAVQYADPHR